MMDWKWGVTKVKEEVSTYGLRNLPSQKHEFSLGPVCLKMAILQVQALSRGLDV